MSRRREQLWRARDSYFLAVKGGNQPLIATRDRSSCGRARDLTQRRRVAQRLVWPTEMIPASAARLARRRLGSARAVRWVPHRSARSVESVSDPPPRTARHLARRVVLVRDEELHFLDAQEELVARAPALARRQRARRPERLTRRARVRRVVGSGGGAGVVGAREGAVRRVLEVREDVHLGVM